MCPERKTKIQNQSEQKLRNTKKISRNHYLLMGASSLCLSAPIHIQEKLSGLFVQRCRFRYISHRNDDNEYSSDPVWIRIDYSGHDDLRCFGHDCRHVVQIVYKKFKPKSFTWKQTNFNSNEINFFFFFFLLKSINQLSCVHDYDSWFTIQISCFFFPDFLIITLNIR